ncbi:MAG: ATP-binding protein [Armatimonadota bacterium]|nr:ATP-binding protein [Armatimonadota bacterium]MDR7421003.1 ATP-binding protein [Armatimonadota bacterium]MDR7453300.1 ATP-binding protein [Armatimonadota bacterium]MDR7457725.1 ATP-binding protein [Armatimonadota bacterium]MDR7497432.1 ATP-binding protein [Armatimonadota bacterium]
MSIRALIARLVEERRTAPLPADGDEPEVRLAVYDTPLAAPRVVSLRGDDFHTLVGELAARTYEVSRERGGRVPYVVIREIMENLIHAYFRNATITVLDEGNTIRVADQGPGIQDKDRALRPGYSTATAEMRRYIRGVGSGLPVAHEQMAFLGGSLVIEDNLEQGTVITLSVRRDPPAPAPAGEPPARHVPEVTPRQKKVLLLIAELGAAGPTTIAKELDISHSTAYRELQVLRGLNLITGRGRGRRTLTEEGIAYLDEVFRS